MAGCILMAVILFSNFVSIVPYSVQLPEKAYYVANYSHHSLHSVPKDVPLQTTVLDLQQNYINILVISDFSSLPNLKVLNMSQNVLGELDCNVFSLNKELVYLDLSHNSLTIISNQCNEGLQHLDLSFNNFQSLSMCEKFENLIHLDFLGLGAEIVHRSDLRGLEHLMLITVVLELEKLSDYEPGSIQMLNTQMLRLVLPIKEMDPWIILSDALNASVSLEVSNINYTTTGIGPESFKHSRVSDMTMEKVTLTWSAMIGLFQAIWKSSVKSLTVKKVTLVGLIKREQFYYGTTSVQAVTVQNVTITKYLFSQDDVYIFFSEMNIQNLTLNHDSILYMLCPSKPSPFRHLNFAHNTLTDATFQDCHTLVRLESLILSWNKLTELSKVSFMVLNMPLLQHLDISHNSLQYEMGDECQWPGSVLSVNLAANDLTDSVFRCLPTTIKKLDLQRNQIGYISAEIVQLLALEELNLASNRLKDLPDCRPFKSLAMLNVAFNVLQSPSSEFLHSCKSVETIEADNNPFQCDCDIREFVYQEKQTSARLTKWPASYQCAYPETVKGTLLQDFRISELSCNRTLLIVLVFITVAVLALFLFCLCKYLDIPWYIKMLWQWTQTRHRNRIRSNRPQSLKQNFSFHAFISYSERDSSWVKECLLPNLEREDGSIQICRHERNFVAGKSIVENIVNCIDKSFKSIFVLSPNFIQSEWCHYELYFAHHKLFTENSNELILVLLEPIPQYLIPARYHKLKALMAQRTYLTWPKERGKQRLFWANLRAAITVNLPEADESGPFQESGERI
ncbi:toll-like receptor 1 [Ambystoma mexicanum]|uniref:toll-like receptor 1 n=1 Tax=Ambystoma mexicanum TaxID=8296 RepID=UPI0037E9BD13